MPSDRDPDTFAQGSVQVLPGAVLRPLVEVVAHCAPIRELPGQQPPLAAGPFQVEQAVDHPPQADRARPPGSHRPLRRGQQRLQQRPLGVGQVGRIRAPIAQYRHAASPASCAPLALPRLQRPRCSIPDQALRRVRSRTGQKNGADLARQPGLAAAGERLDRSTGACHTAAHAQPHFRSLSGTSGGDHSTGPRTLQRLTAQGPLPAP